MIGKVEGALRSGRRVARLGVIAGGLGLAAFGFQRLASRAPAGEWPSPISVAAADPGSERLAPPPATAGGVGLSSEAAGATPTTIFADVPAAHWAREYIEALYRAGYVAGCAASPLRYCPDRVLNRAESAVFVLRGAYGAINSPPWPSPSSQNFGDVPPGFWGYGWIESLYHDGLTAGCSAEPLLYCPQQEHTRAEGSVFFLRVRHGAAYQPPAATGIFADVPPEAWYAGWVEAAYNQGLLPACSSSPLSFCPNTPLDRAWAAYMMVQAKGGLPLPSPTPAAPTPTPAPSAYFAVGSGSVDVIPRQLVRTADDRVVLFVSRPYASGLWAYWTESPGLPDTSAAFGGTASIGTSDDPISVEAAYGGGRFVFVLANLQNGELGAYPFDTQAGSFGSPSILASGIPTVGGDYLGSSGVSAMVDRNGLLQVAYWASGDQIVHQAYSIDPGTGAISLQGPSTRLDGSGSANHPVLAVAPDNSLTVAWVSEAGAPVRILARTRSSTGTWGDLEAVSTAPVWHSTNAGVNIDQGPSLLIGPEGTRHLAYIEDYVSGGDYGRVHYVTRVGTAWTDSTLAIWSHDPALAIDADGDLFLIGHGHPANATCRRMDDMCTASRSRSGTWSNPVVFAAAPSGSSFDSSPSVKWSGSAAGFVRPETVEFAFFSTPYNSPTVYYGRLP
jgi:hypothetical protein